mmetsp:Transcript_3233/g.5774  ORF Transcript_3233/g.5774 Transcript_3233/m.5774 type:complete len:328 (-) Transcript_3233:842-1825(-)
MPSACGPRIASSSTASPARTGYFCAAEVGACAAAKFGTARRRPAMLSPSASSSESMVDSASPPTSVSCFNDNAVHTVSSTDSTFSDFLPVSSSSKAHIARGRQKMSAKDEVTAKGPNTIPEGSAAWKALALPEETMRSAEKRPALDSSAKAVSLQAFPICDTGSFIIACANPNPSTSPKACLCSGLGLWAPAGPPHGRTKMLQVPAPPCASAKAALLLADRLGKSTPIEMLLSMSGSRCLRISAKTSARRARRLLASLAFNSSSSCFCFSASFSAFAFSSLSDFLAAAAAIAAAFSAFLDSTSVDVSLGNSVLVSISVSVDWRSCRC